MNPLGILICTCINTGSSEQMLQGRIQNILSILLHRGMYITSRHQSSGAMCCLHLKVECLLNCEPHDDKLQIFKILHTYFEKSMVYELLF